MAAFTVQNLTNFVTTFTLPYLMNPGYANLGAKVGFIYGSFAFVACIWAFFYYPELKGRSLEEIDLMFEERFPARHTPSKHFQLVFSNPFHTRMLTTVVCCRLEGALPRHCRRKAAH